VFFVVFVDLRCFDATTDSSLARVLCRPCRPCRRCEERFLTLTLMVIINLNFSQFFITFKNTNCTHSRHHASLLVVSKLD
jgi:hypothetical protein